MEDCDIVVQAPGRTCLFGDHQDYLGLPVIACAINRHIVLRAKKNALGKFCIDKPDIGEYRVIDLDSKIEVVEKRTISWPQLRFCNPMDVSQTQDTIYPFLGILP